MHASKNLHAKGIRFITNNYIKEDFSGKKNVHLGQSGNKVLTKKSAKVCKQRED